MSSASRAMLTRTVLRMSATLTFRPMWIHQNFYPPAILLTQKGNPWYSQHIRCLNQRRPLQLRQLRIISHIFRTGLGVLTVSPLGDRIRIIDPRLLHPVPRPYWWRTIVLSATMTTVNVSLFWWPDSTLHGPCFRPSLTPKVPSQQPLPALRDSFATQGTQRSSTNLTKRDPLSLSSRKLFVPPGAKACYITPP